MTSDRAQAEKPGAADGRRWPATDLGATDEDALAIHRATRDAAKWDAYADGWRDALRACADYLDCIPESAAGGDDEAVRLVKMAREALK